MKVSGAGGVLMESMESYGVGLWKFIMRVWKEYSRFTRFDVSDSYKISFWKDVWCGKFS
jgi:hypothetical protein